jgi:hypothetical protein
LRHPFFAHRLRPAEEAGATKKEALVLALFEGEPEWQAADTVAVDLPWTCEIGWFEVREARPSFGLVIATGKGEEPLLRACDDLLMEAHH